VTPTIADADALIDYLADDPHREPRDERERGQRQAAERVDRLLSARALATTSVAAFEVWAGGEDPETIALFAAMRRRIYETDAAAAREAGHIFGELEGQGQRIGAMDCLIAAVALRRKLPLLTANAEHYRRIQRVRPELRLVDART
jgi:predicted nucleic acid-binding protein